jgi:hypothetical protein
VVPGYRLPAPSAADQLETLEPIETLETLEPITEEGPAAAPAPAVPQPVIPTQAPSFAAPSHGTAASYDADPSDDDDDDVLARITPEMIHRVQSGEGDAVLPWQEDEPEAELEELEPMALEDPLEEDDPLDFEEAKAELDKAESRDEIARVVLRYSMTRFTRAALLTVHPAGYAGWQGIGDEVSTDVVRQFQIRADEQSVFRLVVNSRAHYIGPMQTWKAHGPWVKLLGKQLPQSIAVFPVLVRGRCVNLLYGDNGHGQHVDTDVGELLILAQAIAKSYEQLLDKSKAGFGLPAG